MVEEKRRSAARALGEIGDPMPVDPLIKPLKADEADVRRYAATVLGEIRKNESSSLQ